MTKDTILLKDLSIAPDYNKPNRMAEYISKSKRFITDNILN